MLTPSPTALKLRFVAVIYVACLLINSCCFEAIVEDPELPKFIQTCLPQSTSSLDTGVDLYVDYSTCVAEAHKSAYYKATHPSIIDSNPDFYSIKGKQIAKESDDIYTLLNSVHEINYANIKGAVNRIVNGNRQAVLITDGEYFLQGMTLDNLNNPYLASEFRKWVKDGHDIYFYCEPYRESGLYDKWRYYILFTDNSISNNINDRFVRSAPNDERIKIFHFNNGQPDIKYDNRYPDINESLSAIHIGQAGDAYIEEIPVKWKQIARFLKSGDINTDYILRGIFVKHSDNDAYKISKVRPVVYQIYDGYETWQDAMNNNKPAPALNLKLAPWQPFEIVEDIFDKTGEIVLKLKDGFDRHADLDPTPSKPNLLRVDFIVDAASDNFSDNANFKKSFTWQSISATNNHSPNTSMYESISQVIKDPDINPVNQKLILTTIYFSTYSN